MDDRVFNGLFLMRGTEFTLIKGGDGSQMGGTLRANRKIFLKTNNLMLFLLENNIQVLHVSNTILLCILS